MKQLTILCGLFLLTGCVAAAVTGATSTGYTVAQERSVGNAIDDTGIYASIKSRYLQSDVNNLFHAVSVEVDEGRVLLTGQVPTQDSRVEAVRLAWQPRGVKEVINELQISEKYSLKDYANDVYISNNVRSKMLFAKDVHSINYTVDTVKGVVYLMGIAQNQAEFDRVTRIAQKIKGVKQVINHARLKDDPARQ